MSKLDDLLGKKSKVAQDLEAARVNSPEKVLQAELASLEEEIVKAERGLELKRIERARAELARLEKDSKVMVEKIRTLAAELEPKYEELLSRYLAYKGECRRFPDDLSTWTVSPVIGALNSIVISLGEWVKNSEKLNK